MGAEHKIPKLWEETEQNKMDILKGDKIWI